MARKVGNLHAHKLPDPGRVAKYDVFRCDCNREFYMDTTQGMVEAKWYPVDGSSHFVEYAPEEADAPKVGRWEAPKPEPQGQQGGDDGAEGVADSAGEAGAD